MDSLETMKAVVEILRSRGYSADIEYPGWISCRDLCFGDENPTWCWNSPDGEFNGESKIPTESTDAAAIADWVVATVAKNLEARTAIAVERADLALWAAVVKVFPESKSGDLSPLTHHALGEALKRTVSEWVYYNVPKACGGCGRQLDSACGKSLGCSECDGEFCSADCVEVHEKETKHAA